MAGQSATSKSYQSNSADLSGITKTALPFDALFIEEKKKLVGVMSNSNADLLLFEIKLTFIRFAKFRNSNFGQKFKIYTT